MSNFLNIIVMSLKILFQDALTKSAWLFKKYVYKHRLEEVVVRKLVRQNKEDRLLVYIKRHALSSDIITEILSGEDGKLMQEVLKRYSLDETQQEILVEKNNALLLENYLCPDGYFNISRRFKKTVERQFILSIVMAEKMVGLEVFKTYVDNTARDLLEDVLFEALAAKDTFVSRYVLMKCRLTKEQEEYLVANAPQGLLEEYFNEKQLASDVAQLKLVERDFELAKSYFNRYGLRSKAQQTFHELRKKMCVKENEAET